VLTVRLATPADAGQVGRLMFDFNTEFDTPVPPAEVVGERIAALVESGDATVLLADEESPEPVGLAILRMRPNLYEEGLESYLEELYVVPAQRGNGIGSALLDECMELSRQRGATRMYLGTEEDDTAARGLYESSGFNNTAGKPGGPVSYFYEREL
jgi:ribosomal protein S18 acetylase RimI-like enzyme